MIMRAKKIEDSQYKTSFFSKRLVQTKIGFLQKPITAECFKEADESIIKDFANGYLEKAIKQDFTSCK